MNETMGRSRKSVLQTINRLTCNNYIVYKYQSIDNRKFTLSNIPFFSSFRYLVAETSRLIYLHQKDNFLMSDTELILMLDALHTVVSLFEE
jgi:hypothetical protein